jgi:hypothetical protein
MASQPRIRGWIAPACVAAALAGFLVTQYAGALQLPLMTDDYLILGKLHAASFFSLWAPVELLSGFYRPWARELHYWTLSRVFGTVPLPFHLACFILWGAVMALYFVLVRGLAGTAIAMLATCLATTQAAWGVLLIWPAGSQDLWMMASGLLGLVAFARGRTVWAAVALAISLLSKETAATLPAIAALYALIVERRSFVAMLRRTAALWVVVAAWALLHPMIGGRLWHGSPAPAVHVPWGGFAKLAASVRQLVNADVALRPGNGWRQVLLTAWPAAALFVAAVLVGFRAGSDGARCAPDDAARGSSSKGRVGAWAAAWALLGWLPLLMPGIRWHAYYALWGAFGVWTAVAIGLARWRPLALAVVIGLTLLRPARAWTPQVDLGSEWYQARAASLTELVRRDLMGRHASLPSHSRIFLGNVPGGVGLMPSPGHCPALEVWYGDPTLRGYFYSQYAPRAAGDTLGRDYFFVFDSSAHSTEVIRGAEDVSRARDEPDWLQRHLELATLLFMKGDRAACAAEFEKMARVFPEQPSLLFNVGACRESMGDLAGAQAYYRRALALPGASSEMQAIARHDWGAER